MGPQFRCLPDLFCQLGLPGDQALIDAVVWHHQSVTMDIKLSDTEFWTSSLCTFACEEIAEDADWSVVVDDLSRLLR